MATSPVPSYADIKLSEIGNWFKDRSPSGRDICSVFEFTELVHIYCLYHNLDSNKRFADPEQFLKENRYDRERWDTFNGDHAIKLFFIEIEYKYDGLVSLVIGKDGYDIHQYLSKQ